MALRRGGVRELRKLLFRSEAAFSAGQSPQDFRYLCNFGDSLTKSSPGSRDYKKFSNSHEGDFSPFISVPAWMKNYKKASLSLT